MQRSCQGTPVFYHPVSIHECQLQVVSYLGYGGCHSITEPMPVRPFENQKNTAQAPVICSQEGGPCPRLNLEFHSTVRAGTGSAFLTRNSNTLGSVQARRDCSTSPHSGRLKVAQHLSAGIQVRFLNSPACRTTEPRGRSNRS